MAPLPKEGLGLGLQKGAQKNQEMKTLVSVPIINTTTVSVIVWRFNSSSKSSSLNNRLSFITITTWIHVGKCLLLQSLPLLLLFQVMPPLPQPTHWSEEEAQLALWNNIVTAFLQLPQFLPNLLPNELRWIVKKMAAIWRHQQRDTSLSWKSATVVPIRRLVLVWNQVRLVLVQAWPTLLRGLLEGQTHLPGLQVLIGERAL